MCNNGDVQQRRRVCLVVRSPKCLDQQAGFVPRQRHPVADKSSSSRRMRRCRGLQVDRKIASPIVCHQ